MGFIVMFMTSLGLGSSVFGNIHGETFEFLLAICQIPLYPPLLKGDFIIPLFVKEGLGEIFKGLTDSIGYLCPRYGMNLRLCQYILPFFRPDAASKALQSVIEEIIGRRHHNQRQQERGN